MPETFFDRSPAWLLYAGTVLLLLAGNEIGFRLGRWRRAHMPEGEKMHAGAIMGATLGLLAFMLAFTFGMSGTRFETRKQALFAEASAIFRAYQRAQLLPEPQRGVCSRLLQDYVKLRIDAAAAKSVTEVQPLLARSEGIQDSLWKEAEALVDRPGPGVAGFFQSLAELTELQMRRVRDSVWNRIPATILITLYGIAFLALSAMGYGAGLAESRTVIPSVMLILTFSAIIVLIVEMERPRQQLFQVSQEPMADVARRIQALRQ